MANAYAAIAKQLAAGVREDIIATVAQILDAGMEDLPRRISSIEVLVKTDQDEMVLRVFDSAPEALAYLTSYVVDTPDLSGMLDRGRDQEENLK